MNADDAGGLQPELLDDFYAECDEHLTNIRNRLGALEVALARGEADPVALESLYRSAHSFKGNAAIVGLAPAEELAHAAENILRSLSRNESTVSTATLDLLGQTGHRLEQIVTAFRLRQPLPGTSDLLERLARFQPANGNGQKSAPVAAPKPSASTRPPALPPGAQAWQATFAPSVELDRRGVNINSVRQRFAALGEIVTAAPAIRDGQMRFEFTLALREIPTDLAAWEADGVTFRLVEATADATSSAALAAGNEASTPSETGGAVPSNLSIAPSHIVRVDLSRLDELMRITGEMVIERSRLEERIAKVSGDRSGLQEVNLAFTRSLRELRAALMRVRLVPVAEIFSRLPFVIRDLARDSGKKVRLVLEGEETEIDKYIVERLKEPLLHLVRNAVSHGIESPAERVAAGKPEEAVLLLRASAVGDAVQIQIRDDGRGVDAEKIAARARASGLPVPAELDEPAVLKLLCTPGFSTRDEADRTSGRGVGMAVVASTVQELAGHLTLGTETGQWTQFTLRLPLTLSIAETFIVSAAGQLCAVPQGFIEEIVQIDRGDVRMISHVEVVPYRGGLLPLVRLRNLFGAAPATQTKMPVLVIGSERGSTGLVVDRVQGQREVVVRPLQDPLVRVPGISGATELGDGRPVLILDPATLTAGAVRPRQESPSAPSREAKKVS